MRPRAAWTALIAVLLLTVTFLPAVPAQDTSATIDAVETTVQEETWKDVPTLDTVSGDGLPESPVLSGVYMNPYYNASRSHRGVVGHYLAVTVVLPDAPSSPTHPDAAKYLITAELQASADEVLEAKVEKTAPNEFVAEFDLDGELVRGMDGSRDYVHPPLPPGVFDLVVEVWFVSTDPLHGAERVGLATFPVTNDPGRVVSPFLSLFPADHLRKWRGLGGMAHVPMTDQVATDRPTEVAFAFPASAGEPATVSAYMATRRTFQGPGGSGEESEVVVDREDLTGDQTSQAGRIDADLTPSDVLGGKAGDLLVVAGYLSGSDTDDIRVGSALLAVPASDAAARVTSYTEQVVEGPLGEQFSGFEVAVRDESGGSGGADSVALYPGGTLLTAARFTRSETGGGDRYFANFAYEDIRSAGAPSTYRIYTLLYRGTQEDTHEFHALAKARRGLLVSVGSSFQAARDTSFQLPVQLTSTYTDGDGDQEIGFLADATVEVTGLPRDGTVTRRVSLNESETRTVRFEFPPSPPGTYVLTVNVSANEARFGQTVTVTVPGSGTNPIFTPGFAALEAAAMLVAAAGAAALLGRRDRKGRRGRQG